jgi:hypothetical protein
MGWLEFAANIIDNVLSWPVAVLLIVFLLRNQLRGLFHTVENFVLEAGGTKVSFTRSLERARGGVAAARVDILPSPTGSDTSGNLYDEQGSAYTPSNTDAAVPPENEYLNNQHKHAVELAQRHPSFAIPNRSGVWLTTETWLLLTTRSIS